MKSIYPLIGLFLCLFVNTTFSQTLSQAIYMKVTNPDIAGPVGVTGYTNSIELTSAQFGESVTIITNGSRVSVTPISITKLVDKASTSLMNSLVKKIVLGSIVIDFIKPINQNLHLVYRIELTNTYLVKHSVSLTPNCTGCNGLAESFDLLYQKISVTTYYQDDMGGFHSSPVYTFDQAAANQ